MNTETLQKKLDESCIATFGTEFRRAAPPQALRAVGEVIREGIMRQFQQFSGESAGEKKIYYLSMEFLVGKNLRNNLFNLGWEEVFSEVLEKNGFKLEELCAIEPEPGLGNGGLGRLAACYLDAMAGERIPCTGFSICYEFGIFRQRIVDGWQMEFPDDWLSEGDFWLVRHEEESVPVHFGGTVHSWMDSGSFRVNHMDYHSVQAVPYDLYLPGYRSGGVAKLRLWSAKSKKAFDMTAFSRGDYAKALEESTSAEVISKVLYPADDHLAGKRLRLRQQYLLVSASLQNILREHLKENPSPENLAEKAAIHINDTHPALAVPELLRLLIDEYGFGWDKAWSITEKTLSYTNHTVMPEALEKWNMNLFSGELPHIAQICAEIDRRYRLFLAEKGITEPLKIEEMAPISGGEVHMARLCLIACHMINGVSKLHSEILRSDLFRDYAALSPNKFTNVTNGITYRRWLCQANPRLDEYLASLIGPEFRQDASALGKLADYRSDAGVIEKLAAIKRQNKEDLCRLILERNGVRCDPDSLFDVQIKRLHEYKRQLMNVLQILRMALGLLNHPEADFVPRTFLFAAKASPGYVLAKEIIRLIVKTGEFCRSEPLLREKLRVVFLENYNVTLAEKIIPAAEISEQISVAGKEASGTGNMKLMLCGAVTLGTLDGANVEISEAVGTENLFLFGLDAAGAAKKIREGYNPQEYIRRNPELQAVLHLLEGGFMGTDFGAILHALLTGNSGRPDEYLALCDFADYCRAQDLVSKTYADSLTFGKMSLMNTARAGIFSASRAVQEYKARIWRAQ